MKLIKIKNILIVVDKIIFISGEDNLITFHLIGKKEISIVTKSFNIDKLINLMAITDNDLIDLTPMIEDIV